MKIAVIGYGPIARRHINVIEEIKGRKGVELLVCRNRDLPLGDEHSRASVTTNFDDVLDFAPDCAVIASPASKHIEHALALAECGTHLMIEKPLSASLAGTDDLIRARDEKGLAVLVAYNMSYLKPLNFFIDAASNSIGAPISVYAEVGQYLPDWRPGTDYRDTVSASSALGGGVIFELSHELEYVDRLLGGTSSVFCRSGMNSLLDMDAENTADIVIEGKNGAAAHIHMNMLQKVVTRSCRVAGTDGILTLDLMRGAVRRSLKDDNSPVMIYQNISEDRAEVYRAQMAHFFDCADGRASPQVTCERGRRIIEIALAAHESARRGISVVV
jgi:predicted dehydrogenase